MLEFVSDVLFWAVIAAAFLVLQYGLPPWAPASAVMFVGTVISLSKWADRHVRESLDKAAKEGYDKL